MIDVSSILLPHPNPPRMYWGGNQIFLFPPLFLISPLYKATVYTQVTYFAQSAPRPNPQPLPCEGRGVRFKAPLRVGEGFGERSADLCVHRSFIRGD